MIELQEIEDKSSNTPKLRSWSAKGYIYWDTAHNAVMPGREMKIPPIGDNRGSSGMPKLWVTLDYTPRNSITGTFPLYKGDFCCVDVSIEPRLGFWTCPAGFMEKQEPTSGRRIKRNSWRKADQLASCKAKPSAWITHPHINQSSPIFILLN